MRRNPPTSVSGLAPDSRDAAEQASLQSGQSLEDWIASSLAEQTRVKEAPRKRPRSADSLEAALAKVTKVTRQRPSLDFEAIMAAAADSERTARDHASRTAIALDSVASWIEKAEHRLNEASRRAADQRDQIAFTLADALGAMKDRLDTVERRSEQERSRPDVLAPMADALSALRDDMVKLVHRVDAPRDDVWAPVVQGIRADVARLQDSIDGLVTRDEVAGLERVVRYLADTVAQPRSDKDVAALMGSVGDLQRQMHHLSEEMGATVQRRIAAEVEGLKQQLDRAAAGGFDRAAIEALEGELAAMRQTLARMADPDRIERLSEEISTLGRQMAEIRIHQVGRSDFAGLKSTLDEIRSRLKRSEDIQKEGAVPERLDRLSQRVDTLMSRPEPESLAPIAEHLSQVADRLAALEVRSAQPTVSPELLTTAMEQVSGRIDALAVDLKTPAQPMLERLDRIEDGLRQVAHDADTASLEIMLRALAERLEEVAPPSLDIFEAKIDALSARLDDAAAPAGVQQAIAETLLQVKSLREDAALIAERAARAAVRDAQVGAVGNAAEAEAIRQGLAELKAFQVNADRRTQQTLNAVHNALETLVHRAPGAMPAVPRPLDQAQPPTAYNPYPAVRLEAAVRRLHSAAISHAQDITAASPAAGEPRDPWQSDATPSLGSLAEPDTHLRETAEADDPVDGAPPSAEPEEILLEPGTPRSAATPVPTAAFSAPQDGEPSSVRANFIAAVRRAAQASSTESGVAPLRPDADLDPLETPDANQTLIERIRQTFDLHRRPLLLGLALLVLTAGAFEIVTTMGDSREEARIEAPAASASEPGQTSLTVPAPDSAAVSEPPAPVTTGSLLDPSPGASANPVPSETFTAVPKRIPEVDAAEIPATLPASLRQAALEGDPAAAYEIAARAGEGRGIPRDLNLAARLFERAAQAGLVPAQARLGNLYEKGLGVPRDLALARNWYQQAAGRGNARAMHNLAVLFAEGIDGKPDFPAAQRWFQEAAEHGLRDSQFNLGVLLARGLGIRQDLVQSYKWFALAAAQGDEEGGRKRDEIAGRLPAADLPAAKRLVESWRARPLDPAANEVTPAPDGQPPGLPRSGADGTLALSIRSRQAA